MTSFLGANCEHATQPSDMFITHLFLATSPVELWQIGWVHRITRCSSIFVNLTDLPFAPHLSERVSGEVAARVPGVKAVSFRIE